MKDQIIHIAWMFRNYGGVLKRVGRTRIKLDDNGFFSYKGKQFLMVFKEAYFEESSFFTKAVTYTYFFNIDNGRQILLHKPSNKDLDTLFEFIDDLVDKHITYDLLRASKSKLNLRELIPYLIGFVGMGFGLGFLIHFLGVLYWGW